MLNHDMVSCSLIQNYGMISCNIIQNHDMISCSLIQNYGMISCSIIQNHGMVSCSLIQNHDMVSCSIIQNYGMISCSIIQNHGMISCRIIQNYGMIPCISTYQSFQTRTNHRYYSSTDEFTFTSRRYADYPFNLIIYINGRQDSRLSGCCEHRYRQGSRIGGPSGHFILKKVDGERSCAR